MWVIMSSSSHHQLPSSPLYVPQRKKPINTVINQSSGSKIRADNLAFAKPMEQYKVKG